MTTSTDDSLPAFLLQLDAFGLERKMTGDQKGRFNCPVCGDTKLSATYEIGDNRRNVVVCCHRRSCRFDAIAAALFLPQAMFFGSASSKSKGDDRAQRKRDAQTVERAAALAGDDVLLGQMWAHYRWPAWALADLAIGRFEPGRLAFPYRDAQGRVIGTTLYVLDHLRGWVAAPAKVMTPGSRHGLLYPVAGITADPVAIVEGGAAAVAALVCGYQPLAVSSASFMPPASWARLVRDRHVVVLPDADTPGRAAGDLLATWALTGAAASVTNVDLLPDLRHGEDLADVLREEGKDRAVEIVHGATAKADRAVPTVNRGGRPSRESGAAEAWLMDVLGEGQWVRSRDLAATRPNGLSDRTLERARKKLGIESRQYHREWWVCKRPTN